MVFHCDVCNLSVNSEEQLNQHYSGSKHKRGAASASNQNNPHQNKSEKIKAAGMNNFVKAEMSLPHAVQSQNITTSTDDPFTVDASDVGTDTNYCSTCRVSMTSSAQANMHYTGSKHRNKIQMLEDMKRLNSGSSPQNFCETCQIQLTSPTQAQVHYSGSKHALRCKQLQENSSSNQGSNIEATPPAVQSPQGGDDKNSLTFCYTCRVQFTSPSQAQMHYQGGKHRNRIKLLDDKKSMTTSTNASQEDGEPSAKRPKYLQTCDTCNVKLTCPDSATTHYNGAKHAKKLLLLKQFDQGASGTNTNTSSEWNAGIGGVTPGVKMVGHLYCSFCNVSMNSQGQMDAHRSGSKHKSNVERLANPNKPKPKPAMMTPANGGGGGYSMKPMGNPGPSHRGAFSRGASSSHSGPGRPMASRGGAFQNGAPPPSHSSHSGFGRPMASRGAFPSSHSGHMAQQGAGPPPSSQYSHMMQQEPVSQFGGHGMQQQQPPASYLPFGPQPGDHSTPYPYHEVY